MTDARLRFHLDENMNPVLAVGLRQRGVDVTTSAEMGLLSATDEEQLAFASRQSRVLVTHDRDFLRLAAHEATHAGIAYCDQHKYTVGDLIRALFTLRARAIPREMAGKVAYL